MTIDAQQSPRVADPVTADVVLAMRDHDRNVFFPDLARLQDGTLLATYYESRQHMHTPDSTIRLVRGSSDGQRWSTPVTIIDNPGLDDRDPSVCQLRNGRILVTWFRRRPGDLESSDAVCLTMYSDDEGASWSTPIPVPSSAFLPATTAPPLELVDGRLLLPCYGFVSPSDRTYAVHLAVSRDHGESWDLDSEISVLLPAESGVGLVEPTLATLSEDELIMVIRSRNHPENRAYAAWSSDRGATWTVPRQLDFAGHAPHLLPLDDGSTRRRFLLTWGEYLAYDMSTRPVLGRIVDGRDPDLAGETFMIYANANTYDMSYPSAVLVSPDTALVIHYDSDRGTIGGTFVTLDQS